MDAPEGTIDLSGTMDLSSDLHLPPVMDVLHVYGRKKKILPYLVD
jgi:hypothetical protein